MLGYDEQVKAIGVIKRAMEFVKQAHDNAGIKHDNYGEFYMDDVQYEIMQETEALTKEMNDIILMID